MSKPLLSVTVLNYNYGRFLDECLRSILSQTFRDFELIVIDDCSSDDSLDVVRPYLADSRVKLVAHETNQGFRASLIEGTELHSRGDYCTVISADDFVLRPDAFAKQMDVIRANPGVVMAFSSFAHVFPDREAQVRHSLPEGTILTSRQAFEHFLLDKQFWALHSGTIFAKDAYKAAGGYRRDVSMALEVALWFPLSLQGSVAYLSDVLYGYRMHPHQMSASKLRVQSAEVAKLVGEAWAAAYERGFVTRGSRRRALGIHLGRSIMHEAFSNPRLIALGRIMDSFMASPLAVLLSSALWIALTRVALGERGFHSLRSLGRTRARRTPQVTGRAV